jgi:peptidoglycan/LPS O-acetylase OafA/YrhL
LLSQKIQHPTSWSADGAGWPVHDQSRSEHHEHTDQSVRTGNASIEKLVMSRVYRPDIDGLRAISIVLVVGYHYFGLPGGYVGVDVFFVISGYLITGILLDELDGGGLRLREFYARRVRRILPPLFIVLVTCLCVGWLFLLPYDFRVLAKESVAGALYVINFLFWQESGYFDASAVTKPLLHLWSLAVEEQFYLIWPALLLLGNACRRRTDVAILTVLVFSFLISVATAQHDQPAAFYSPLCRLWELAAGGLLAQLELKRRRADERALSQPWRPHWMRSGASYVGLAVILGAGGLYRGFQHFPGYLALAPVLGAGLTLAAGAESTPNRKFLASGPMVYIGKLSYCLYLWHWAVLILAGLIFHHKQSLFSNTGCLLVTCALSLATFYLCEQPIRTIPVHSGNTWKYLGAGTAAAAGIAAVALLMLSGRLARASDAKLINRMYQRPANGCMFRGLSAVEAKPEIFTPCETIQFPKRPVVILVGDSHANALYGGLKPYLDARRVNLIEYAVTNCMPLTTTGVSAVCAATARYFLGKIRQIGPGLVVLSAYHLDWSKELPSDYPHRVIQNMSALRRNGARQVLIVGQVPTWDDPLPSILNREYLLLGQDAPQRMFTGLVTESDGFDAAMHQASSDQGVSYFSLWETLCDSQGCETKVGNHLPDDLIVYDSDHLTTAGARHVMELGLGREIEALLVPPPRIDGLDSTSRQ